MDRGLIINHQNPVIPERIEVHTALCAFLSEIPNFSHAPLYRIFALHRATDKERNFEGFLNTEDRLGVCYYLVKANRVPVQNVSTPWCTATRIIL